MHRFNSLVKQGQGLQKLPKYMIILHSIDIRMLHLTFEGWNLRRFVQIQWICLCTIVCMFMLCARVCCARVYVVRVCVCICMLYVCDHGCVSVCI